MKIDSAKFKNFGPVENLEIKFHDTVTRLVGRNGSGKTTVGLKGFMSCVNGIAESSSGGKLPGERFRFIGKNGKSADVEYGFIDEATGQKFWIKNHITEASNKITFRGEGDSLVNEAWLKVFLDTALMSAKAFTALSGIDQARAIGIDTSSFDLKIKEYKSEFTLLNRELKAFGILTEPEKGELVDINLLLAQKKEIKDKLNNIYFANKKKNQEARNAHLKIVEKLRTDTEIFQNQQTQNRINITKASECDCALKQLGYTGDEVMKFIKAMPQPQPMSAQEAPKLVLIEEMPNDSEIVAIDQQIAGAEKNNFKLSIYREYLKNLVAKQAKEKEIADNKAKQDEEIKAREAYIKQSSFQFAGLGTDSEGGLLLNNRPINSSYFSAGELELVVAKLHLAQNPVFKVRFIDDFDLIDDENQEKILTELLAAGFQVITAEVGEKSDKENVIVLRECAIANDEDAKPSLI
jgi:hypothetical protein